MTLAQDLVGHVQRVRVTQGVGAGGRLQLLPFQRRFLRRLEQPGDVALSVARGAGKTTLAAAIADAALVGPLARPRGDVVMVASSFAQARIGFEALLAGLTRPRSEFSVNNSQSYAAVTHKETGARVRVLGSDPRRMHGLQPVLVIADEPAQWPANTSDAAYSACTTSLGKMPGSRLIAIGTQASDGAHWFSKLLAANGQVHAADQDDPPFRFTSWAKANPALRDPLFAELRTRVKQEAEAARRDGALLQSFRALRLNQPVSDVVEQLLLEAGTWQAAEGNAPRDGYPVAVGIDLGSAAAMSGAAAVWSSGRLESFAVFPAKPSLSERGLADGVGDLYRRMAVRGELLVRGERVSDVPALLDEIRTRWGVPAMLVADRWRDAELRQALEASSFPRVPLIRRGAGFKTGSEDVRAFRRAVVDGRVTPVKSLLMRAAMSEARTVSDVAGNAKLAKGSQGGRRAHARDDAAAAAILAVSAAVRHARQVEQPRQEVVLV